MGDGHRKPTRLMTWGAAMVVAACIAMLGLTQLFFAHDIDRYAREQSEQIVVQSVDDYGRNLAQRLFPQTYWDDAVVNLDNRFDPRWAKMMIGDFFVMSQDLDIAAVFDRRDRPLMVRSSGRMSTGLKREFAAGVAPLLSEVRALERERGPLAVVQPEGVKIKRVAAHDVASVGGRTYIVTAALVQPDVRARPLAARSAIVVVAKELTPAAVADLAAMHRISDMSLLPAGKLPPEKNASVALRSHSGKLVGWLTWSPRAPGMAFVMKSFPYLMIFVVLVAGAILWMTLRTRKLTQSLMVSEARASHMAFHDILTGLPNRARLESAYATLSAEAVARGRSFAMLCIDLDHFKAVNDSLGHLAGDALIRVIAGRIRSVCDQGEFIARFGGDEFILLQEEADARRAAVLAERLIAAIAEPVELEAGRVFVGASIGIVVCSWENLSANECLRRADLALYDSKDAGRNCYRHFRRPWTARFVGAS